MKKYLIAVLILSALALSYCSKKASVDEQLVKAAKAGNVAKVKELLGKNANPNCKVGGVTPLVWASYKGQLGIVKLLLAKGADINAQDKDGDTPLIAAVFANQPGIVEYLFAKGANKEIKNKKGKTALMVAKEKKRNKIIKILSHGYDPEALEADRRSLRGYSTDQPSGGDNALLPEHNRGTAPAENAAPGAGAAGGR